MSFSANHRSKKNSLNYFKKEYLEDNNQRVSSCKRDSSKKEINNLNLPNINYQNIQNIFSYSSLNTNISNNVKDKKDELLFNTYPIKPIIEDNLEDNFIQKRKKVYKPKTILNNKIISFQKQANKQILEFPLFDEKLIFKDINRSYLQDEYSDDGSESGDEKINEGKIFLSQELEDSVKQLSQSLKNKESHNLLSRGMRFKQ